MEPDCAFLHVVDGIAFSGKHSMFTATAEKFLETGRKLIKDIMAHMKKQQVQADSHMVENLTGRAADTIVKEANKWKADVIVMGAHGRRGFNRLMLGSDAELVVRTASVPVLLVQPSKTSRRGGRASAEKFRHVEDFACLKSAKKFRVVCSARASKFVARSVARHSATCFTNAGSLVFPRNGTGAR